MSELRFGEIIRMNKNEGFGVIMDENFQDIHFNLVNLPEGIHINDKVSFEIELGEEGLMATNVRLI